jgi:hypothetical protein
VRFKRIALAIWLSFWAVAIAWVFIGVPADGDIGVGDAIGVTLIYGVFVTVGALIVARVPENSVGWILCAIGLGAHLGNFLQVYVTYRGTSEGFLVRAAGWIGHWLWPLSIVMLVFLLLLFPTGRPIPGRLRYVFHFALTGVSLFAVAFMFKPAQLEIDVPMENPLGVHLLDPVWPVIETFGAFSIPVAAFGGLVTLLVRARRATGVELQQLKWFGLSAATMVVLNFGITPLLESVIGEGAWSNYVFIFALALLPLATGVAILRYRLYDIDVIINKALVYGGISAILIAVYVGIVVSLQAILQDLTAESDLAVAASTLAVAALFQPMRAMMQRTIDKRFYRRRYDAARSLSEFSRRLRDRVELEAVESDLAEVIADTLQPAHSSVWLTAKSNT